MDAGKIKMTAEATETITGIRQAEILTLLITNRSRKKAAKTLEVNTVTVKVLKRARGKTIEMMEAFASAAETVTRNAKTIIRNAEAIIGNAEMVTRNAEAIARNLITIDKNTSLIINTKKHNQMIYNQINKKYHIAINSEKTYPGQD